MPLTIFSVVVGALLSLAIVIWVESQRRPRLAIRIRPPADRNYEGQPARNARFLEVDVENLALANWQRWMLRQAAVNCRAAIAFFNLNGQPLFAKELAARWSASPEPVPEIEGAIEDTIEGKPRSLYLIDRARITILSQIDIPPGETEALGIAGRFDEDADAYGWGNESYFSNPAWRNPAWRLPEGRFIVRSCHFFDLSSCIAHGDYQKADSSSGS